ncbi:MAG: hypothetical protein ABII09_02325 [Planctomycetota bacterium]
MAYLTAEQFKETLANNSLAAIAQHHVFQGLPYVFRDEPASNDLLVGNLCDALDVYEQNVIVIGSAKVGFSLNPNNFPRKFSETSDIDVIVISEELFDKVWMILLEWQYPRRLLNLGGLEGRWAATRRKDIYWGYMVPDEISYQGLSFPEALKPLRDVSAQWFNTFQSLSLHPEFASRTISGRLYRTWDHALRYHTDGLRQIRNRIIAV